MSEKELAELRSLARRLTDELDRRDREEGKKKNANFIQTYRPLDRFVELSRDNHKAATVLWALANKMDHQNAVVMTMPTLVELTKIPERTVRRAIATLKEQKWIQVLKVGTANAYVINSSVMWRDSADKKRQYATFSAQVVANKKEQSKEDQLAIERGESPELIDFPVAADGELLPLLGEQGEMFPGEEITDVEPLEDGE